MSTAVPSDGPQCVRCSSPWGRGTHPAGLGLLLQCVDAAAVGAQVRHQSLVLLQQSLQETGSQVVDCSGLSRSESETNDSEDRADHFLVGVSINYILKRETPLICKLCIDRNQVIFLNVVS